MQVALIPHPLHPPRAIERVEVEIERPTVDRLELGYWVFGDMDELRLSAPAAPLRGDSLWKTTCFELFFASLGEHTYREFNFSPSTEWAAYDFPQYRHPNPDLARLPEYPLVELKLRRADRLLLTASVALDFDDELPRMGLSAVIDERNGARSFWALTHPNPEKPDFHLEACFAGQLPPAPGT